MQCSSGEDEPGALQQQEMRGEEAETLDRGEGEPRAGGEREKSLVSDQTLSQHSTQHSEKTDTTLTSDILKTNIQYTSNTITTDLQNNFAIDNQIPSSSQYQCSVSASAGNSEQNIDQFNNLNDRVQQQNNDQFKPQQHQPQQQYDQHQSSYQQQTNNNNNNNNFRFRSYNSGQTSSPGFMFHHQQSAQRGFIPPLQQQNFVTNSFYPPGATGPNHSFNNNNVNAQHNNPNNFHSNFPGSARSSSSYEEAPGDNLDNSNNNVSGVTGQNTHHHHHHQFSLRARRRVRQRVDAGEPRNSYSSIPGFSFRHQNMMSRHFHHNNNNTDRDDYTSGLYRGGGGGGGVFSLRGRGRHLPAPGGHHPVHPLHPYNTHLPFPRYRHPSLVHSHHPPSFPMSGAAAVVQRALLGWPGAGALVQQRDSGAAGAGQTVSGDADTKTVLSLFRDETSEKSDVPPISSSSTPPTTPPLLDREHTTSTGKVKITNSSESSNSDPTSKDNNNSSSNPAKIQDKDITKNALLIRELLTSKLAAVTDQMMDQGFGLVAAHTGPRDFSQHSLPINNNELKENQAAQIMSHLLKVRQEMALNMSKDSDSDRHTESPGHISDNDIIEDDNKDEPINLHQNGRSSAAGSGSDGEAFPASPSSDAGNSTSSAKEQKASRLENIVGGLARSTSSPLPPAQGCKKRKLYLPVQHDVTEEEIKENEKQEEPEQKKLKDGMMENLKTMQDQFQKMHEKIYKGQNDENADPAEDTELHIDLGREDKKFNKEEILIEKRLNPKPFAALGQHPLLNGSADPLPIPPNPMAPNYMDLAKRFLQEKQDQLTKEMITRELVDTTIGKNEIAEKLKAISPDLEGLADILKSELKTSLTMIVDTVVQRYLTQKRQPLSKFSENSLFSGEHKSKTPSGRAPQVRDRSTPRTIQNPVSMANPVAGVNSLVSSNNLVMTASSAPRFSLPTSGSTVDLTAAPKPPPMMSLYPALNGQISDEEKDDESEQDDALNLTVTPKKKRHKVTDTRITPRTVSRLLGEQPSLADLHKHLGASGVSPFVAPGFLPRPPFLGLPGSFPPNIPTSLNPSLSHPAEHFPFSPFGFPGPLTRPRDLSPPSRPRSASPPRDTRPPPPLIHPALLAAQSPDFPHMRPETLDNRASSEAGSDDLKMEIGNSPFSLGNMSGE